MDNRVARIALATTRFYRLVEITKSLNSIREKVDTTLLEEIDSIIEKLKISTAEAYEQAWRF
jgi:hypothetical protein